MVDLMSADGLTQPPALVQGKIALPTAWAVVVLPSHTGHTPFPSPFRLPHPAQNNKCQSRPIRAALDTGGLLWDNEGER